MRREPRSIPPAFCSASYLGTLGGALVGRDGTCGGAPNVSLLLGKGGRGPGRNGTGGAPEWGPGEGMAGAGPRPDVGLERGVLRVSLLWVVGLGGGDLRRDRSWFAHCYFGLEFIFKKVLLFLLFKIYFLTL